MEDHSSPEFVREPDFLMNTAFEEEEELQDTQPADAARMLQSSDDEWMSSEPNIPASPTEETPQLPADVMEEPVSPTSPTKEASKVPADTTQESEGLTLDKLADESDEDVLEETEWAEPPGTVSEQITEDVTIVDADYDDPQIAQMAVNLTQMSLESTAEATVLSKGNMLVAYAGPLSDADIDALSDKIADGWKDIGESNSRVRYVTLPSNGLDYMVYSRRTHEDFILSMVFASKTPLSVIREQGKRIGDALRSVPELVLEDEPLLESDGVTAGGDQPSRGGMQLQGLVDAENVTLADHTFVWLLRDPDEALAYATTEAINAGLRVQLHEMGWRVDVLDVEEDYVYLLAGVPGEQPPYEVVRGLQDRASQIARQQEQGLQTDGLWAESYFILSPGRELNVQEIQQYINFYRM
jgi:REP element-mobilizing transposase RayT